MGMGKWGGYHTEIAHLARGFAGHDRALALAIGERLVNAGLLVEKQSVHQRHVRLNPRRVARDPRARRPRRAAARARAARPTTAQRLARTVRVRAWIPPRAGPTDRILHHARVVKTLVDAGLIAPIAPRPPRARRPLARCAGAPTSAGAIAVAAARAPAPAGRRSTSSARSATASCTAARTRSPARSPPHGIRAGRRRRDHVPQPPRLHGRHRRLLAARRPRALPQHDVRRPAARRRRRARGREGDRLRRGVRRARRAARAASTSASSPGTTARAPAATRCSRT